LDLALFDFHLFGLFDFHLFGPLKEYLRGQKFEVDETIKAAVDMSV